MTPIKTGAWVYDEQRKEYYRCDLYEYFPKPESNDSFGLLLARCNARSVTRDAPNDEGLWATMHTTDSDFHDGVSTTLISTDYTVHWQIKFHSGGWHNVKIG